MKSEALNACAEADAKMLVTSHLEHGSNPSLVLVLHYSKEGLYVDRASVHTRSKVKMKCRLLNSNANKSLCLSEGDNAFIR